MLPSYYYSSAMEVLEVRLDSPLITFADLQFLNA